MEEEDGFHERGEDGLFAKGKSLSFSLSLCEVLSDHPPL